MLDSLAHTSRQVFVFEDADFEKTLELVDTTTDYSLTGSMYVLRQPYLSCTY